MGNLSNLYISQSFISLIHLGSNNTASVNYTELEDGLGNGLGVYVNNQGDIKMDGTFSTGRGLDLTGSVKINVETTGSTPEYLNENTNNIMVPGKIIIVNGPSGSAGETPPTISDVVTGWKAYGPGLPIPTYVLSVTHSLNQTDIELDNALAEYSESYYFTSPPIYPNVSLSGSMDITGSLWVRDKITATDISASNSISASDLWVENTIHAYKLDVTIESSSIIFTSGSNIIGDEANVDTQTLVGRVIVTGSLEVTGSTRINGNVDSTGSLKVTSDISSSTISGLGNATLYSASVFQHITDVSASISGTINNLSSSVSGTINNLSASVSGTINILSTSVNSRLGLLESFSSSQYKADSSSFNSRITAQENFSSSLVVTFATVAYVNSVSQSLSSSFYTSQNNLSSSIYQTDTTQSLNITINSASAWGAFQSASAYSASAASTFVKLNGGNTISGSQIYSGSVRGQVFPITISSNTASMDCSLGNFFTVTLPAGTTRLIATNINPGETISLRIINATSASAITSGSSVKFPTGFNYVPTTVSASIDIITFLSFDTASIYAVAANYFA